MLQFIMWNGQKIWTKKIWIKKKFELKKIWKKIFSVRTYVKPNLVFSKISFMLRGGGQKIKVDQNGMKHGLILEFLRSDEIFEIWSEKLTGRQASKQASKQARQHTSGHHSDQISRSALRDGATKKANGMESILSFET